VKHLAKEVRERLTAASIVAAAAKAKQMTFAATSAAKAISEAPKVKKAAAAAAIASTAISAALKQTRPTAVLIPRFSRLRFRLDDVV
jgi:hypothetical protein